MPKRIDITGKRFGNLVGVRFVAMRNGKSRWQFKCDCGGEAELTASAVISGNTSSCGCIKKANRWPGTRTHGQTSRKGKNRLYRAWAAMRQRCSNPNHQVYAWYGGRGIKVCSEWDEYPAFMAWALANGYTDDLSIDRVDPDGDYEPSNCRWITMKENLARRRPRGTVTNSSRKR